MISINPLFSGSTDLFSVFNTGPSESSANQPSDTNLSALNQNTPENTEEKFTEKLLQILNEAKHVPDPLQKEKALAAKKQQAKKLWDVSLALESLFVYKMFQVMRKANLQGDQLIKQNNAGKIFEDFLTAEQSQLAVQSQSKNLFEDPKNISIPKKPQSPFGLASSIYQQNSLFLQAIPARKF